MIIRYLDPQGSSKPVNKNLLGLSDVGSGLKV